MGAAGSAMYSDCDMRRFLLKAFAAIAALIVVLCAGVYAYARRSLPMVDGEVSVAGISAPVEIIRDADAIPHILARTRLDALFGLGYVHAQDRLWQMEFQRRVGQGRLSEMFGIATIAQDRFLRTVGFRRAAHAASQTLPEEAWRQVDAYVAGVNAFVSTHHCSALPPEFAILQFEPEPWTPDDVIVWVKMMAWDLSANYSFELLRHDLLARVGAERMAELMPPYPKDGLSILTDRDAPWMNAESGGEETGSVVWTFPPALALQSRELRRGAPKRQGRGGGRSAKADDPGNLWSDAFASGVSQGSPAVADLL